MLFSYPEIRIFSNTISTLMVNTTTLLVSVLFMGSCIQDKNTTTRDTLRNSENQHQTSLKSDPNRYLAHAGGEIDGNRYTNSLEAIDYNYSRGFRVFEIDIIQTSDGHLVCAHDWESWQRFTGYEGNIPPTLDTFLKHKIKKDYTALSLAQLSNWFKKHPDAILFTDKINNPEEVVASFSHKSQLRMKLVSNAAVNKAKMLDVEFAIAENLVDFENPRVLTTLRNNEVTYIVISRKSITKHEAVLKKLKKGGIKTYASHVNFDKGKDEMYVYKNEMEFIYGFYADVWDFKK